MISRDSVVEKIKDIVAFIVRHINRRTIVVLVAIILIGVFMSRFQIVYVDIRTPSDDADRAIATAIATQESHSIGGGGIKLLSKDVSSIAVSSGKQSASMMPTNTPWYSFRYLRFDLSYAFDGEKVAYQNLLGSNCATYDNTKHALLSYNCENPINLSEYKRDKTGLWSENPLFDFQYLGNTALPYMGGVIGVRPFGENAPDGALVVYRADKSPISYKIPDELKNTDLASIQFMTHFTDPSDSRFVLADKKGAVYIATTDPSNQSVSYEKNNAPKGYPETGLYNTLCRLSSEAVYCYRGSRPIGHGTDHKNSYEYISIYDKNGGTKDYKLKNIEGLDKFYVTDGGEAYALKDNTLYHLEKSNSTYSPRLISHEVSGLAAGNALYFIYQKGVYRIDNPSDQANLVFYSPNVNPASAFLVNDTTYVIGSLEGNDSETASTYAYKLSNDRYDGGKPRFFDVLPAQSGDLTKVGSQSLVGNQYYASINVEINKTDPTKPPVDSRKLTEARVKIIRELQKKGIDPSKLNISIGY